MALSINNNIQDVNASFSIPIHKHKSFEDVSNLLHLLAHIRNVLICLSFFECMNRIIIDCVFVCGEEISSRFISSACTCIVCNNAFSDSHVHILRSKNSNYQLRTLHRLANRHCLPNSLPQDGRG